MSESNESFEKKVKDALRSKQNSSSTTPTEVLLLKQKIDALESQLGVLRGFVSQATAFMEKLSKGKISTDTGNNEGEGDEPSENTPDIREVVKSIIKEMELEKQQQEMESAKERVSTIVESQIAEFYGKYGALIENGIVKVDDNLIKAWSGAVAANPDGAPKLEDYVERFNDDFAKARKIVEGTIKDKSEGFDVPEGKSGGDGKIEKDWLEKAKKGGPISTKDLARALVETED